MTQFIRKYRFLVVILGVIVLGSSSLAAYKLLQHQKESVPEAIEISTLHADNVKSEQGGNSATTTQETINDGDAIGTATDRGNTPDASTSTQDTSNDAVTILPELNLKLAFYSQAPFGNWDYPWQEACEEASVLLVANAYFNHQWTAEQFNNELLKLVEWEKQRFGSYEHTNVDQTAIILKEYLGLQIKIHEDPRYEDVQKVLSKGNLIVMTFAGKKLGNPYYTNGGPVYHAMVIKGYKQGEKVITHDVGTRRGENYVYTWNVLRNALHDYAEPIEKGPKQMIEVIPPSAQ